MAPPRWWLPVLAVASLVVLVYAGVFTAFSVPVSPGMEEANRLPGAPGPAHGTRALVVPIAQPSAVATRVNAEPGAQGVNSTLLLVADEQPTFPAGARNATLANAVAYVTPTANGTYFPPVLHLENVTFLDDGTVNETNLTIDVGALAQGRGGFLVRHGTQREVFFVEADRIVGTVERFEPGALLAALYGVGAVGFVAPLIALIVTHRGAGREGPPPTGQCTECRAPMREDETFCARCGAWVRRGP